MNAELMSLTDDLTALAADSAWPRTRRYLAALRDAGQRPDVALIRLPEADARVAPWLDSCLAGRTLADVSADPAGPEMWLAERVLIAFPCGGLPSASIVHDLTRGAHARPMGTVWLALTGAEKIESGEDLRVVEATARRWLLPPGPASQELGTAGGYLWSEQAIQNPSLAERVARDMQSLLRSLQRPLSAAEQTDFAWKQLAFALQLAETEAMPEDAADDVRPRLRSYEAQDDLAELRDRIFLRLRSGAEALEASARVACDGLEQDLLAGLPAFMQNHPALAQQPAQATTLFESYCAEVVRAWASVPRSAVNQWERTIADVEGLLRASETWRLVNEASGSTVYPERILASLKRASIDLRPLETTAAHDLDEPAAARSNFMSTLVGAVLGAGAGLVTGFGSPALVVGLGVGALAGDAYRRYGDVAARSSAFEAAARIEIGRMVRAARSYLSDVVAEQTHELRRQLADEFAMVQAALERSFQAQLGDQRRVAGVRERLQQLQRRFGEIAPQT